MKSGNPVATPLLKLAVLTDSQMRGLHLAALEVLRRTGVEFQHEGAVDLLRDAGAFISHDNLVRFPGCIPIL